MVATDIPILDLDVFGVDLDLGSPVAAFQMKKSKDDCCMTYKIYSLQRPPKLLRTLTGASSFAAGDTDLDGQVEIWADDAAAVDGIDHLSLAELDFAPPIVLRFEKGELLDVSSEFAPDYDKRIEKVRSALDEHDLNDFKSSDGKLLSNDPSESDRIHRLRAAKAKVLEITWLYLYSGRERAAWQTLDEMWPASDRERIDGIISKARVTGLRTQLDGVESPVPEKRKVAKIFDATPAHRELTQRTDSYHPLEVDESQAPTPVIAAIPILVRSSPMLGEANDALVQGELKVEFVIDSAGKVRSAATIGTTGWKGLDLMAALSGWKFVPAFKGHRAVASSMVQIFSLKQ